MLVQLIPSDQLKAMLSYEFYSYFLHIFKGFTLAKGMEKSNLMVSGSPDLVGRGKTGKPSGVIS